MSINLPFWNEKETDVQIEYRLQFGHVLSTENDFDQLLKKIRKAFNLKKPLHIFEALDVHSLPLDEQKTTYLLNDTEKWHFIIAKFASNIMTIHAPHFLFFNNKKWIVLSKLLKSSFLVVSEQLDHDLFHYIIFKGGKLYCNAYRNSEGICKSTHAPVNVYFKDELIFHKEDDSQNLNSELVELLSDDMYMIGAPERGVKYLKPMQNNEIKPVMTFHIVFNASG